MLMPDARLRRNTYVCLNGGTSLQNHLDTKRVLLEHEDLRREYGDVKRRLVEEAGDGLANMDDYVRGKTEVLMKILKRAGWSEERMEEVRRMND